MKRWLILAALLALTAGVAGEMAIHDVKAMREAHDVDGDRQEVFYQFGADGEKVLSLEHVKTRAHEAAEEWKGFEKDVDTLVVLARSPFGGGETSRTYWPAGVKAELLRKVVAPLTKQGFENVVLPDLPPEEDSDDEDADDEEPVEIKPFPKRGFSDDEDYDFVLVIGLHHEKIPYKGASRRVAEKIGRVYSSRVTAWAILFHGPTGCAIWGTTALAKVGKVAVSDTLNSASEAALVRLDFSDMGKPNIADHIRSFKARTGLPQMDLAAMLVQTQRVDAVWAVMNAAKSKKAFVSKAWVVRFFNSKSIIQDFRLDPAKAVGGGCVQVNQQVPMRYILLEQLRGVRSIQPMMLAVMMPLKWDVEIIELAQKQMSLTGPCTPDDEIVLITELAHQPPSRSQGPWKKNTTQAVRNLGYCRYHIDEAMAVARTYAMRKVPPPRRGRRRRRDAFKEAGQWAMRELNKARAKRSESTRDRLQELKDQLGID